MATKRRRLLVVDDDESLRKDYLRVLASDFEVGAVAGAAQAIECLKSEAFDLIITDETVADMDGFALLDRLREREIRMPMILLTAALDNHAVLRAGDALCLAKPVDVEILLEAVHSRMPSLVSSLVSKRSALSVVAQEITTVTATIAKTEFRRVLETATKRGRVIITKYQDPCAVLMSFDEYERLTGTRGPHLDELSAEFDELLAKMQTPEARAGTAALFSMSSDDLGRAAVSAAKKLA